MSKEALAAACEEKVKQLEFSVQQSAFDSIRHELETELAIARVALLALRERAEPEFYGPYTPVMVGAGVWVSIADELPPHLDGRKVWVTTSPTAPPAPVVPDALEQFAEFMAAESIKAGDYPDGWKCKAANAAHEYAQACRAAMLAAAPQREAKNV